jgi:hypothetical protein
MSSTKRVPLSGAARYQGGCHDVDVYAFGKDAAPLVAEVKATEIPRMTDSGTPRQVR